MAEREAHPDVTIVGVPVARLGTDEIVDTVIGWTDTAGVKVAIGVNAYVCNMAARDKRFAAGLRDSGLNYADGQVIVWASRALGSPIPERSATTDLVYPLVTALAGAGKRVYLFGGAPGVAELAGQRLVEFAPGLEIRVRHGDVSAQNTALVLAELDEFRPDVLLIGLGDPLQQNWIADNRASLTVPAVLTCGGLFDWVSGAHRRAPSWMIRGGLEWLWRLALEPRRLANRYLVGNPVFLGRLAAQVVRSRATRGAGAR
jgi:N-acetylglucosaminyldiphosphoundecaprenol N-acetyl-beta-D-mannosaminyltransferase